MIATWAGLAVAILALIGQATAPRWWRLPARPSPPATAEEFLDGGADRYLLAVEACLMHRWRRSRAWLLLGAMGAGIAMGGLFATRI